MQEPLSSLIEQVLIPSIAALGGGFSGWFFGRAKQKADTEGAELNNVDKALSIYRNAILDLERWKGELLERMKQIEHENETLLAQLKTAHRENDSLRYRIASLEKDLNILKSKG